MSKTHAFTAGDIIKGYPTASSYHLLITEVLDDPCYYSAIALETGSTIKRLHMPSRYFKKVA